MIASRWFLLGPVAVLAWACGEKPGDSGSSTGGTGPASGGAGTPTGGSSGAGATPSGGTAGSGATPSGGNGGSGMSGASGDAGSGVSGSAGSATGGSAGTGPQTTCTFTITPSLSERIPTVGIVEFTTDLVGMTEARIEFGRDTSYGMTAPVDLTATNYRTLLLGMKPVTMYHYRIVASAPSGQCTGADNMIETGARANTLPTFTVDTMNAAALSPGFLLTGQYQGAGMTGAPAFIIDADGDFVWWHFPGGTQKTNVRMSYDGKHMWIQNANVPESEGATVHRVSMDGMTVEDLSDDFEGANHQFTVLPDETVVFYAYNQSAGCDDIKARSPSGDVRTIINSAMAHGAGGPCHVNAIEYSPMDETVVFSDLDNNNYTKVTLDGEVVWILGGSTSDFTGMPAQWQRQHGIDVLGLDRFLIFNNGPMGSGASVVFEILLDLQAMTATRPWSYTPMGVGNNLIMGDTQRLANGNTVIAYSAEGVIHEVNAQGQLLQEISSTATFGYIQKRATLYGAPPR
jgi:hypothetical protein